TRVRRSSRPSRSASRTRGRATPTTPVTSVSPTPRPKRATSTEPPSGRLPTAPPGLLASRNTWERRWRRLVSAKRSAQRPFWHNLASENQVMDTGERLRQLRAAVSTADGQALIAYLHESGISRDFLQLIGDGLLGALAQGVDGR